MFFKTNFIRLKVNSLQIYLYQSKIKINVSSNILINCLKHCNMCQKQ